MMQKIFGIEFHNMKQVDNLFDCYIEDDEQVFFVSNKTFHHIEDGLTFDYKYVIECVYCEGKWYYSLQLVVAPNSLNKDYKNSVASCSCVEANEVDYFDVCTYGGASVQFGCETTDGEMFDKNVADKIASVFEVMDNLRGFYLDKCWNRIGTTGWDTLYHAVNGEKLFKF